MAAAIVPTTPAKKIDLPPKGARNPDPITNEAGAHPIETGVGAAVGGAGAGFAAGMAAGPIGAAVGTVVGAVAGGLAGKAVGEKIDPTVENMWLNEYYSSVPSTIKSSGRTAEDYRGAYRHGLNAKLTNQNVPYEDVEDKLQKDWNGMNDSTLLEWDAAQPAVRHAYDRDVTQCKAR
ncbi:MAG: hypothetical protein QM703_13820 [Gemmatales bacterium]